MRIETKKIVMLMCAGILITACVRDGDGSNLDDVGRPCVEADDCYFGVDTDELQGDVVCLDEVEDGYCTHHCNTDEDCCAAKGECEHLDELDYVCGPFQSTGERYCFISCEDVKNEGEFCQNWAHPEFNCRSTGGGSLNRKVCVPNG